MTQIDFYTGIDQSPDLEPLEGESDIESLQPPLAELGARGHAARRTRERPRRLWAVIGAYAQVVVVAASLVGLYWWPRPKSCGSGLAAFIGAECMIIGGAMWCTESTWRSRLAGLHAVAVTLLVAALAAVALQVLTRLGYVSIAGFPPMQWSCG